MGYDKQLANAVRQELEKQLGPALFEDEVVEKKMFGGLAFMVRGSLCLTVSGRKGVCLMVRVGDTCDDLERRAGASTTIMRGKSRKGYVDLDERGLEELGYWIDKALKFNCTL